MYARIARGVVVVLQASAVLLQIKLRPQREGVVAAV
jgi:hypothetical protein